MKDLSNFLILMGKIVTVSMSIPIILALFRYKYLNKVLKVMLLFSTTRFLISLLNVLIIWATGKYKDFFIPILNRLDIHNMNFIQILAYLNNFGLLGYYFYLVLINEKLSKTIKYVSGFFFISSLINYLFVEGYKNQSIYNSTSSSIFCFVLPLIHLGFVYRQDSKVPIVRNSYFWISLGLLIPNLLIFIYAIMGRKASLTDLTLYLKLDITSSIIQILGYLLIAIGFYYARYTKYLPQNTPSEKG